MLKALRSTASSSVVAPSVVCGGRHVGLHRYAGQEAERVHVAFEGRAAQRSVGRDVRGNRANLRLHRAGLAGDLHVGYIAFDDGDAHDAVLERLRGNERERQRVAALLVQLGHAVGGLDQLADRDVLADERREASRDFVERHRLHALDLERGRRQMSRQQLLELRRLRRDLHGDVRTLFRCVDLRKGVERVACRARLRVCAAGRCDGEQQHPTVESGFHCSSS